MGTSPLIIDNAFICTSCGAKTDISLPGRSWSIRSPADVADRLMLQMAHLDREVLDVLSLDTKNRVMDQTRLYVGNVSQSLVRVAEVLRPPLLLGASGLILVHPHPSGNPDPSPDDLHLTAQVLAAARLMDLALLDHILVGRDGWISLRDRGILFTR